MTKMKDRLLTALSRKEELLYDVYLALLDHKFCGPWVPLLNNMGQPVGSFVREDHNGDICAQVSLPTEPNSFGPKGFHKWHAQHLPVADQENLGEIPPPSGATDDLDEAKSQADEALSQKGWVLVPANKWVSPSGVAPEGMLVGIANLTKVTPTSPFLSLQDLFTQMEVYKSTPQ